MCYSCFPFLTSWYLNTNNNYEIYLQNILNVFSMVCFLMEEFGSMEEGGFVLFWFWFWQFLHCGQLHLLTTKFKRGEKRRGSLLVKKLCHNLHWILIQIIKNANYLCVGGLNLPSLEPSSLISLHDSLRLPQDNRLRLVCGNGILFM